MNRRVTKIENLVEIGTLTETTCTRHDAYVASQAGGFRPAAESGTVGELLYKKQAHGPISETVWVNLVRSIAAGDQLALHSIYTRTYRLVFTLVMRITNNWETAEELTVDVFHDVWRRAAAYDPANGSVVGWIMNQARSRAIDRLRYELRKKRVNNQAEPPLTGSQEGPQNALHIDEQNRLLRTALDTLTPHEKDAIEMAFFSEMTYREVADRLNQPLGTIKSRIRSGLIKLREVLAEEVSGK